MVKKTNPLLQFCFQDENMLQDLYISVEDEFGIPTDLWRFKETSEQVQIISLIKIYKF